MSRRRFFRYRVTDVTGSMVGRVEVGDLTFDTWHGSAHTYTVAKLRSGEYTGSYSVRSEGECTDAQYASLGQKRVAV
jgi:hypothetical protein